MAKATKQPKKRSRKKLGGPFLAAAFFCEKVIEDEDGALSALRIVDACSIREVAAGDVPFERPVIVSILALVILRSGDAAGPHELAVVPELPDGTRMDTESREVFLPEAPNGGTTMQFNVTFPAKQSGIFWLDVFLDGKLSTRMPLMVTRT